MVQYLIRNPDIVALVANGQASLVGVSAIQQQALIEVFDNKDIKSA
ncbi:competence pheromone ComX [Paenibacillus albiflavus]|nr:competence pheromone ComX [Paenibacillus albiflavus]